MSRSRRPVGNEAGFGRLKWGFVLLVGISGGLIAFQEDAPLAVVGLATLGGILAGGALMWYLLWITRG